MNASNSFKMITDFVPGSYMVHDQLHVRGGHQVTWAIDGVPIPNTNIASTVGPQFNPKDVSYMQAETGSYGAEYGDRTYGVFNVAPNSGFERNREAEFIGGYGNFNQTDDWLSFGDHTEKFAYYVSGSGNSTEYGLEPPTPVNLHNEAQGGGAFTSLLYNPELRRPAALYRRAAPGLLPGSERSLTAGGRHSTIASASRTSSAPSPGRTRYSPSLMLTVSPFYHFNRGAFEGGPNDVPIATDNRASNYEGGQITLSVINKRNNARRRRLRLRAAGQLVLLRRCQRWLGRSVQPARVSRRQPGSAVPGGPVQGVVVADADRRYSAHALCRRRSTRMPPTRDSVWPSRFRSCTGCLRAAYSYFYQPPPLDTVSGPLLQFVASQGFGFLPLKGERDIQQEYGVTIPIHSWVLTETYFHTGAQNFFDHDALGNSNIFLPLTIQAARIEGFETTLRSPTAAQPLSRAPGVLQPDGAGIWRGHRWAHRFRPA